MRPSRHYLNRLVNGVRRRLGLPYWSMSGVIKRRVKGAVSYINRFEDTMVRDATRLEVDGVICGHIHQPVIHEIEGIIYCNCGDWVENCTAVVEEPNGELRLLWWHCQVDERCDGMPGDVTMSRLSSMNPETEVLV